MPQFSIKLVRIGDPPVLPNVSHLTELRLETITILEAGMTSGRASVGFHLVDEKGNNYLAQTSADLADGISGAIIAAAFQFGIKPLRDQSDYFLAPVKRMSEALKNFYMQQPGATEEKFKEYQEKLILDS